MKVRWAKGQADKPQSGEYVARLSIIGDDGAGLPDSFTSEHHPGRGQVAAGIVVDRESGKIIGRTEPRPTDLSVGRVRMMLTVTAHDGRELRARFDPDASAPQVPSDADGDLLDALNRAWRNRPRIGRPRGHTNIESDQQVADAVALTRRKNRRLTARNVGTWSETFTYSNLRSYLRVTHRTWQELLDTLLASEPPARPRSSARGADSKGPSKP